MPSISRKPASCPPARGVNAGLGGPWRGPGLGPSGLAGTDRRISLVLLPPLTAEADASSERSTTARSLSRAGDLVPSPELANAFGRTATTAPIKTIGRT